MRAGIGNSKIFKIRSEKDLSLNFRSATFSTEWLAMTQGVEVLSDETVQVMRAETICVDDGKYTTVSAPVGDEVHVKDEAGVWKPVPTLANVLEETALEALFTIATVVPDEVEVYYKEEVIGEVIEFDAKKFASKYSVQLSTIAYDLDSGEVYSDIFFEFPETIPGGDFSLSFEAGSVITPEISFDVLQPKCGKPMGRMINAPRPK